MDTVSFEHAGITIEGLSLAGVRTCITLPQLSFAFDVAQGLPHAIKMNTFFITHGHMDHASGIPYIISQKAMHSHKTPRFYMPESMVGPMYEIMKQWSRIESHEYEFEFIGVKPNDEFSLGSKYAVRTFKTIHRIPSIGYSLYRKHHKLRADLVGKTGSEIAELRANGIDPTEEQNELLLSFTGDTQIEFLELNPDVLNSKILLMETTYLDEKKTVQSARDWGHTHLDELIPRLSSIKSEKIVLIHSSARYPMHEAQEILKAHLPQHEHERVVLFSGR